MRPMDFAAQLNVSLANGWGIVRTVADLCLERPEGKYVLVKDPNKVSIYPCFVVCVAVPAHFKGTANFRAYPDGAPSTVPLSTHSLLTVSFFTAGYSAVCRAFLGIHRRRRGGRRRGFRGRSGVLTHSLGRRCVHSLIVDGDYDKCIHAQITQ
jgi:hypothetical protein